MKNITANVQIQFDQFDDQDSTEHTIKTLNKINEIIQREMNDISPIIFTNSIDSSDIVVVDETEQDEE